MELATRYGTFWAFSILLDASYFHERKAASLTTDSRALELIHNHRLESRNIIAVIDDQVPILVLAFA